MLPVIAERYADMDDRSSSEEDDEEDLITLRKKIRRLKEDRRKRIEYTERLQDKLKALNQEISTRRLELEAERSKSQARKSADTSQHERSEEAEQSTSLKQNRAIRDCLEQLLYTKIGELKRKNSSMPWETKAADRIVSKGRGGGGGGRDDKKDDELRVDSVLILYSPYGTDACDFWEVNESEHVLRNSQGAKAPDNANVQRDTGGKGSGEEKQEKRAGGSSDAPTFQKIAEEFPGLFHVLRVAKKPAAFDMKSVSVWDVGIYIVLLSLTVYMFFEEHPQSVFGPPLDHIQTTDEMFSWLRGTFAAQVFDSTSSIRTFNLPVGLVRIKQQVVSRSSCERKGVEPFVGECFPLKYSQPFAERQAVAFYQELTTTGNCSTVIANRATTCPGCANPSEFLTASTSSGTHRKIATEGYLQVYDPSGFAIDFCTYADGTICSTADDTAGFREVINCLEEADWLGNGTRSVEVEMALYNGAYDRFIPVLAHFEMPFSKGVFASIKVNAVKLAVNETPAELRLFNVHVVRLVFVFFLLTSFLYRMVFKAARTSVLSFLKTLFQIEQLLDMAVAGTCFYVFALRTMTLKIDIDTVVNASRSRGFLSWLRESEVYLQMVSIEGLIILLLLSRFVTFFKVVPKLRALYNVVSSAAGRYVYFVCFFVPVLFGFVLIAHAIWGSYLDQFSTVQDSFVAVLLFMKGDIALRDMLEIEAAWTIIFAFSYYLIVTFFMMNMFTAIVIDAYYTTSITEGHRESMTGPHGAMSWVEWLVPSSVVDTCKFMRGVFNQKKNADDANDLGEAEVEEKGDRVERAPGGAGRQGGGKFQRMTTAASVSPH
uniref:Uncharacterized protein n=1 Tax=Chromera velia CCMP2878 TaxID=1169474 RepID=A0A0G4GZA1_9ALVE|eukprot:Cvel_5451.t1-p1 / transcript=Cvel_5451.t1 / gene=Cvel_5451 / organism=Chromera_velia_CCMP2878 / gene_product=Polycystin-2, putative / transcript_product=Polycystin-2, putative / location=Cvel_scaffold254:82075-95487(-) / protein_length=827 / sequence_SO=supercontig / SO=protein_coding / is_pseudo=false